MIASFFHWQVHITPLGWIAFCLVISSLVIIIGIRAVILNLYRFLAKTSPIAAAVMVVEGWMPDYAIKAALSEFNQGSYRQIITVGGLLPKGFHLSQYQTFSQLTAATLVALGVDPQQLIILSEPHTYENRTSRSATTLREWLVTSALSGSEIKVDPEIKAVNICTLGTHARRSWGLYRKELEPEVKVGVIAISPLDYDPKAWWKTSEGFRTVISELIAYLHAQVSGKI